MRVASHFNPTTALASYSWARNANTLVQGNRRASLPTAPVSLTRPAPSFAPAPTTNRDTKRQPSSTGEQRQLGLLIRGFLPFTGNPFVIQPDDSFDDYACEHERTQSNPQALPREERRAVAAIYERTRTGGNVFLHRVAQVRFLS